MSYLNTLEKDDLKDLRAMCDAGDLDADDYKDAKSTIMLAAKKRRLLVTPEFSAVAATQEVVASLPPQVVPVGVLPTLATGAPAAAAARLFAPRESSGTPAAPVVAGSATGASSSSSCSSATSKTTLGHFFNVSPASYVPPHDC
jgi:hypothetical protein